MVQAGGDYANKLIIQHGPSVLDFASSVSSVIGYFAPAFTLLSVGLTAESIALKMQNPNNTTEGDIAGDVIGAVVGTKDPVAGIIVNAAVDAITKEIAERDNNSKENTDEQNKSQQKETIKIEETESEKIIRIMSYE